MPRADVAVTGCAGFIGFHAARRLLERGYRVLCIDDLSRGDPARVEELKRAGAVVEIADVRELELLEAGAVVHAAALISVEESWEKPLLYHEVNAAGTLRTLLAALRAGARRFVYVSSAAVYGEPAKLPIPEDHPTRPISPYGASKLAGEKYVEVYSGRLRAVVLRLFNVYGPGQNREYAGVVAKFLERAKAGLPPIIFGDGEQTRDFVHVEDVAAAVEWALAVEPGVYNIGTGTPTRIRDLAKLVMEIYGVGGEPIYAPPRPGDIRHSYADIGRAMARGWRPRVRLEEGLRGLARSACG